jgi:hypothetical protein
MIDDLFFIHPQIGKTHHAINMSGTCGISTDFILFLPPYLNINLHGSVASSARKIPEG